ncbi:MAG: 50S ribosomal protein L1 [Legionellales bacterium]|jgi:large subunit ribosomal protein L1|nr:50S ribosomal protein L1 [Legionellales bacterium]HBH11343.1 50S ribosomal protein L1 [Gammaproteobacteria bacterium]|tara:strand:- start:1257 stop:1952 length:696 start_codon:yes stop_codon:yes gene_type:complete
MAKLSKRINAFRDKVELGKYYSIQDAVNLLKEISSVKFDESVEVAINLGVDARKSDQQVRGSTVLPKGTGKTVKVAVFTEGENAKLAKAAGADVVGFEDLAETMQKGAVNYDVVIATPDAMPVVGKLGKVLGPRGLMPNPKDGTVTKDIEQAVKNSKSGQVRYKTDKNGIIHCVIGKVSFETDSLIENLHTLLTDLAKIKPSSAKGTYLKKLSLSTTMGPGLLVDQSSLSI